MRTGVSEASGRTRRQDEWLTTEDCAQALGCSRQTVVRDIDAGLIEARITRRPHGRARISVHIDSLRAFAADPPALRRQVERWLTVERFTRNKAS